MDYAALKLDKPIADTPPKVADFMVRLAKIEPHHTVLEPSAGKGNLVEAIYRGVPGYSKNVTICEANERNRDILFKKFGRLILTHDFLKLNKKDYRFNRILMNPPLKHSVAHIVHAVSLLKPQGRTVALVHNIILDELPLDLPIFAIYPVGRDCFSDSSINASILLIAESFEQYGHS